MSWAVGFDSRWGRDVGYGVPAVCDRPGCGEKINRGLSYVCGGEPYGGERGCGLCFCGQHLTGTRKAGDRFVRVCGRCDKNRPPYEPTPDTAEWLNWKLADESWAEWRRLNPAQVEGMRAAAAAMEALARTVAAGNPLKEIGADPDPMRNCWPEAPRREPGDQPPDEDRLTEHIVIRDPLGLCPPGWDGRWLLRERAFARWPSGDELARRGLANVAAMPTPRFETREDGAFAQVYEVQRAPDGRR